MTQATEFTVCGETFRVVWNGYAGGRVAVRHDGNRCAAYLPVGARAYIGDTEYRVVQHIGGYAEMEPAPSAPASFWYMDGDDFPLVAPSTSRADLVAHVLADADGAPAEGRFLAGITTGRKRVLDPAGTRTVTRDWRTAVVVLWTEDGDAPTLDRAVYREVMAEVQAAGGADDLLIYGRLATYDSRTIMFEQFGVRAR